MRSKIILAIIAALLSGATLAADPLPSTGFSEPTWIPASPHQLQVLGLSKVEGAGHAGFTPVSPYESAAVRVLWELLWYLNTGQIKL
jgi:hypothetical protein